MPTYKVTKTYRHTETVEVEADNSKEALRKAYAVDGIHNNDDVLVDEWVHLVGNTYGQTPETTTK